MRHEKQFLLDEITDQMAEHGSYIMMGHAGLTANLANQFRREVARMGGSVSMVRKRLLVKAAKESGLDLNTKMLPGHIGLIFAGSDILEATKFVFKFGKDNDEKVTVLGGRFEGQLYNASSMKQLSELPSKDEMRAQLLAVFEAPMAQTLSTMQALLTSIMFCLENKSNK